MKITYKLTADDFLVFQLYANSKSEQNNRIRNISKNRIPLFYLLLSVFFIYTGDDITGFIFIFVGLLWYGFYPKYLLSKTKKYLINHINENYAEKINITNEIDFQDEYIYEKSKNGEFKRRTSTLKKIVELNEYYLIFFSKIEALIVPKSVIEHITEFKEQINKYNIEYIDERAWKWD